MAKFTTDLTKDGLNSSAMQKILSKKWPNLFQCCHFNSNRVQLETTPKVTRQPIRPHYWYKPNKAPDQIQPFNVIAAFRRFILLLLIIGQTFIGSRYLISLLPYQGWQELSFFNDWQLNPMVALENIMPYAIQVVIITLFAILFAWISLGFWTAIMGIMVTLIGKERFTLAIPNNPSNHINPNHRTALVMPICNEDVARVFAGLKATWHSLHQTGQLPLCDFYILSDTSYPDIYANELNAWADLVNELNLKNQIYYRHRERRVKRKSGNIDDFCRRFGHQYEYMIILDADSVMTGECISNMIAMMEMAPNAGIIQSPPKTIRMRTLYGRIQQFANQTYSDIFSSGVHFWQLSEAQYWGHNAIIRLKPFIEHCILTPFNKRGKPHHILSHDLVEAALMRSAGWQVWIAYNLQGSYEEVPANIIEDLKRDNRWCIGNLINLRTLFKPGLLFVQRIMFITSAMAYVSSLLWLLFLVFSTLLLLLFNVDQPHYFLHPNQLYPVWPRWDEHLAVQLLGTTFALLLTPKLASYVIILLKQKPSTVGGIIPFTCSILLEILFSMILAPIRMIYHSTFVIKALIGSKIHWKSPARHDDALTWREAIHSSWSLSFIGIIWLCLVLLINPQFTTWFIAILLPLIISPCVIRYSSFTSLGMRAQHLKLFMTKEEISPNLVIINTDDYLQHNEQKIILQAYRFSVTDPTLNALVCVISTHRHCDNRKNYDYRRRLFKRCIQKPDDHISENNKLKVMADPFIFMQLHLYSKQEK
jgi:membrane glycosyltransferase